MFTSSPHAPLTTIRPDVAFFKPKKVGRAQAHVVFILDDSGSMQACRAETIAGFNEFLQGQKNNLDLRTYVSLYKFDGVNVTCVLSRADVDRVEPLTTASYNPQGTTNLLDAIGTVIFKVNEFIAVQLKKERDAVTVVVLTDGAENASHRFSAEAVKTLIEKTEVRGWTYFFLGANIDAFSVSSTLGFGAGNTIQYDPAAIGHTFVAASNAVNRAKSMYASGAKDVDDIYASSAFTAAERAAARK